MKLNHRTYYVGRIRSNRVDIEMGVSLALERLKMIRESSLDSLLSTLNKDYDLRLSYVDDNVLELIPYEDRAAGHAVDITCFVEKWQITYSESDTVESAIEHFLFNGISEVQETDLQEALVEFVLRDPQKIEEGH